MKKIIIAAAFLLPFLASAAPIVPGTGGDLNCIPWNIHMPDESHMANGTLYTNKATSYQGQAVCEGGLTFKDTNARLYALETAVADLQAQNTALRSQVNLQQAQNTALRSQVNLQQAQTGTQPATVAPTTQDAAVADLEERVSALENVTKAIQQSLVYVIQLLTGALNGIKSHA